jgi:hypothetical protein
MFAVDLLIYFPLVKCLTLFGSVDGIFNKFGISFQNCFLEISFTELQFENSFEIARTYNLQKSNK